MDAGGPRCTKYLSDVVETDFTSRQSEHGKACAGAHRVSCTFSKVQRTEKGIRESRSF